jgi:hypothetical protein
MLINIVSIILGVVALAYKSTIYTSREKIINSSPIQATHKIKETLMV